MAEYRLQEDMGPDASATLVAGLDEPGGPPIPFQRKFPIELLYHFLDQCHHIHTREGTSAAVTFRSCAIVCKQWHPIVWKFLFSHVESLPHEPSRTLPRFLQFLDANPDIYPFVKSLRIKGDPQTMATTERRPTVYLNQIWAVVLRLSALERLGLGHIQLELCADGERDPITGAPPIPWFSELSLPAKGEEAVGPVATQQTEHFGHLRPLKGMHLFFVDLVAAEIDVEKTVGKADHPFSLLFGAFSSIEDLVISSTCIFSSQLSLSNPESGGSSQALATLKVHRPKVTSLRLVPGTRNGFMTAQLSLQLFECLTLPGLDTIGFYGRDHQNLDFISYQILVNTARHSIEDLFISIPTSVIVSGDEIYRTPPISLSSCPNLKTVGFAMYLGPDHSGVALFNTSLLYGVSALSSIQPGHSSLETVSVEVFGTLHSPSDSRAIPDSRFQLDFRDLERALDRITANDNGGGSDPASHQAGENIGAPSTSSHKSKLSLNFTLYHPLDVEDATVTGNMEFTREVFEEGLRNISQKYSVTIICEES